MCVCVCVFVCCHCSYPDYGVVELSGKDVCPRARTVYQWHQLEAGMVVMVNYNPDEPKERGYWYDAEIQRKRETRTQREVYAKILLGYVRTHARTPQLTHPLNTAGVCMHTTALTHPLNTAGVRTHTTAVTRIKYCWGTYTHHCSNTH